MTLEVAEKAYWNLVVAAKADHGVSPEEQKVLNAHGLKLGLDSSRARDLQAAAEAQSPAHLKTPGDPMEGLQTMRALLEVAAADGSISPGELKVAGTLARHLGITKNGLETLVTAALSRSASKRDRAFGKARPAPGTGEELPFEPPEPEGRGGGGFVRTIPLVARLAPSSRSCSKCGLAFADRNPYARRCRVCSGDPSAPREPTSLTQETSFFVFFVLFAVLAGWFTEKVLGLWSWGWESVGSRSGLTSRRRRGDWIYYVPALAMTLGPAWLAAWGATWLVLQVFPRKGSPPSR